MAMEICTLGNTGIQVSSVGFGVLPLGPAQLSLPLEEGAEILAYGLSRGINFVDTAQYYRASPYIRRGLELFDSASTGQQPVVLCSKSLATTYDEMALAIDQERRALNRDVIDIFLLHEVRPNQLAGRTGPWQCLQDAKAKGHIRAAGLSTHHVDVVQVAASMDELDVVFPLLNYAGLGIRQGDRFASAADMEAAIHKCNTAGKGVFTMKAFGGGALTATYQQALNYVFGQPDVHSVMIGFGKTKDVDDIIAYIDGTMAKDYNPDVSKKRVYINQEDCEGCGACKSTCPAAAIFYNQRGLAQVDHSKCLTCGYCSPVCPVRAVIMY